jgi:filamentous hemagglutinin family protein
MLTQARCIVKRKVLFVAVASVFADTALAQVVSTGATPGSSVSTGQHTVVSQGTQRAIFDWSSFNIGAGASVTFNQPNATSLAVNRISGGRTTIDGALTANGHVMLLNQNGVLFGQTAVVNVGSLTASTGRLASTDDAAFIDPANGHLAVSIIGAVSGEIKNQGTITVGSQGLVAFVAPSVVNSGTITAIGGRITLAGAQEATVSLNGGLYEIVVDKGIGGSSAKNIVEVVEGVTQTGTLNTGTSAGRIVMSALDASNVASGAINLEGVQRANRIEVHGGTVVLMSDLEATTVTGSSSTINVSGTGKLQDAVDIAKNGTSVDGATVRVNGGAYSGEVTLNKEYLTVTGNTNATLNVAAGERGFNITKDGVTVEGMKIVGPYSQEYTAVDWNNVPTTTAGVTLQPGVNNATIRNNDIRNVRTGVQILGTTTGTRVLDNVIDNTKGSILLRSSGVAMTGNKWAPSGRGNEWDIVFLNNIADGAYFTSPNADQKQYGADMMAMSGANNGMHILDRRYGSNGLLGSTPQFGNRSHIAVSAGSNFTAADDFNLGNGLGNARQPLGFIDTGINSVVWGGFVDIAAGTYTPTATLKVNKSLTLRGAGQASTFIDSRAVIGYGMQVTADKVALSDFTIYGPFSTTTDRADAYGIKVQPATSAASDRVRDFKISRVTSRGAGRAELDLNGVDGATIDSVTADGKRYNPSSPATEVDTKGAGIQITDSANVVVRNSITRNNLWGGMALYQANRFYNQQMSNIKVEGSNTFGEANQLYLQDESASRNFGSMELQGFTYAVRNPTTSGTTDQSQYTWMQKTAQGAYDMAVNAGNSDSSYIQGWSGTLTQDFNAGLTQNFYVGIGNLAAGTSKAMKIKPAVDIAADGATINLGAGDFRENVTLTKPVTIVGAGNGVVPNTPVTTLRAATTGGDAVTVNNASGVTLTDLKIADSLNGFFIKGTSHNAKLQRVAFNNVTNAVRTATDAKSDNFKMYDSFITGGKIGVGAYNEYNETTGLATGSFANAEFRDVKVEGQSWKGFYFETADNLWLNRVEIKNAGNIGSDSLESGHAIDINLKYAAFSSIKLQDVKVINSGDSSGRASGAGIAVKTRGLPGDDSRYTRKAASLQRLEIIGGSIEESDGMGIRFEDLSNGAGGRPTVTIRGGTAFKNNGRDIVTQSSAIDATGAAFMDADGNVVTDGFTIEDRVTHALDPDGRGLVTWNPGNVYVTENSGSIQRGIDASCECDTVNVAGATFAENVILNSVRDLRFNNTTLQNLTLASGAAGSGIAGRVTATGSTGFLFNAPVRLLGDTSLVARGGNITFGGDVRNAGNSAFALSLDAGGGDVSMFTGGTQANPLGRFTVLADDFNLSSTLWVSGYDINTTGNVALADHTLNSVGALLSLISAGGNVTGSTTSQGSLQIAGGGNVTTNVISLGNVEIVATNVGGNITGAYIVIGAENNVNANVSSVQVVEITSGGTATVSGTAQSLVLNAANANATGNFGEVVNASGGNVTVNGKPQPTTRAVELSVQTILPTTVVTAADSEAGPGAPVGGNAKPAMKLATAESKDGQPARSPHDAAELVRRGESIEIDLTPGNK